MTTFGRRLSKEIKTQSDYEFYARAKDTLARRYNESTKLGKAINVSDIRKDGVGIRRYKPPSLSQNKKIGDLKIYSNNYAAYSYAMELLGPEYEQYDLAYKNRYGTGYTNGRVAQLVELDKKSMANKVISPPRQTSPTMLNRLNDKVNQARISGRVIDVSNILADGTNTKSLKVPKIAGIKKKGDTKLAPIVSDNYESYHKVLKLYGFKDKDIYRAYHGTK